MDEEEYRQQLRAELKKMHRTVARIVSTLAGLEGVDRRLLVDGNTLLSTISEALSLNAAGKSINQSKEDSAGSFWWDGRLGSWFFGFLRVGLNMDT